MCIQEDKGEPSARRGRLRRARACAHGLERRQLDVDESRRSLIVRQPADAPAHVDLGLVGDQEVVAHQHEHAAFHHPERVPV